MDHERVNLSPKGVKGSILSSILSFYDTVGKTSSSTKIIDDHRAGETTPKAEILPAFWMVSSLFSKDSKTSAFLQKSS